ncbi:FtsX domain-containing protein [Balamuthia mandrillaris]
MYAPLHLAAFWALMLELWVAVRYALSDSRKNYRNFIIAVITVFIVVTFVVALSTAIGKAPLVFLKLAENTLGEYDLVMTPTFEQPVLQPAQIISSENNTTYESSTFLLNATSIMQRLSGVPQVEGVVPRWALLGRVGNRFEPERNSSAIILIIDTEAEKRVGLGRGWEHRALGEKEALVSGPLLRNLGIKANAGEWMSLTFDLTDLSTDAGGFSPDLLDRAARQFFILTAKQVLANKTLTIDISNATQVQQQIARLANITLPIELVEQALIVIRANFGGSSIIEVNSDEYLTDELLSDIFDQFYSQTSGASNLLRFSTDIMVAGSVEEPRGKWPAALGTVVIMEAKYVPFLIFKELLPPFFKEDAQLLRTILSALPGMRLPPPPADPSHDSVDLLLKDFPIYDYAPLVIVQKKGRIGTYIQGQSERDEELIAWTNGISLALGLALPMDYKLPINEFLNTVDIARAFLDQLLIVIVSVLILHSMLVIYSLLLSNAEEKTYEYGMLRALGMQHNSLIKLLTIQALYFSLPAIGLGLGAAFLVNIPVAYFIASYSDTEMDIRLSSISIAIGLALGFIMPIIANIIPIRRALTQTLRDALDIYHQSFSDTLVRIVRLENMGISIEQTVSSIMAVVFGFLLIYVVPFAFRYEYWSLFLGLLNATLLGMVIGLAMVASILQKKVERWMLHLLMWGKARKLKSLVRKALTAHGDRNRKTALMFTTVVAFLIFASAIFHLQTASVVDNARVLSGSDILFQTIAWGHRLPEDQMREFLDEHLQSKNPYIKSYSFATLPFHQLGGIRHTYLSNMARHPWGKVDLYGVEENYMHTMYDEYFMASDIDEEFSYKQTAKGKPNVIASLYDDAGKAEFPIDKQDHIPPVLGTGSTDNTSYIDLDRSKYPTLFPRPEEEEEGGFDVPYIVYQDEETTYNNYIDVIASTAHKGLAVYMYEPAQLIVRFKVTRIHQSRLTYLAKPRALVSKCPGFLFSWLELLAGAYQPVLITMDSFDRLSRELYEARINASQVAGLNVLPEYLRPPPAKPPKAKLLVRMVDGATRDQREFIINSLRNFMDDDRVLVSDTADAIDATAFAVDLLLTFFYIISFIAMVLCFFVLWISFTSNVRENAWEYGVLRAVGLANREVLSIYVFEALALTLTSIIFATGIGVAVAYTLSFQYSLFNQMSVQIFFPWKVFFAMLGMSLCVAVLGSYLPARSLGKKEIAQAIRGK